MTIKMPMDQDLYDAAVKVTDAIEEKLATEPRREDHEVLGRSIAAAYRSWRSLLVSKYVTSSTEPAPEDVAPPEPKLDGRRNNQPAKPQKSHPWRARAKR
jgi:hypothetical protein